MLVITGFLVTLALLAGLQFRWTGQLSESQRLTMESSLANSMRQFEREFNRELSFLLAVFRPDPVAAANGDWHRYLERYDEWYQSSDFAPLISRVLLYLTPTDGDQQVYELQLDEWKLAEIDWSDKHARLRDQIATWDARFEEGRVRDARMFSWTFFSGEKILALPLNFLNGNDRGARQFDAISRAGYLIVELDPAYLSQRMIPELVGRYFSGPDGEQLYKVAVLGDPGAEVLYRSHEADSHGEPDLRASLLPARREGQRGGGGPPGIVPPWQEFRGRGGPARDDRRPRGGPGEQGRRRGGGPGGLGGPGGPGGVGGRPDMFFGRSAVFFAAGDEGSDWVVTAKHIAGSLDAAVQLQRRRDLGVGLGILLLLAGAMALVLISSQRAKRLADMQMEFVAGVSHELRTPLAVICSAGDNLADGVVSSSDQVPEYGRLIRDQGRRLAEMVEQTLRFATLQSGKSTFKLESVDVAQLIAETLDQAGPAIEQAGFELQQVVERDLPPVRADRSALRQSLENLVNNAVKYGADRRWLKVEAADVRTNGSREVQIRVHDHGLGIMPKDAKNIFDAFYRGAAATEAQIEGSGLGLKLARDMALGMGGDLTLKSEPGQGSIFTIHLPLAEV